MDEPTSVNMVIVRSLLFANGTAYDLVATKNYIHHLWDRQEVEFERYEEILDALNFIRHEPTIPDFIINPFTGVLWLTPMWFAEFGMEDTLLLERSDSSLISFSTSDDEFAGSDEDPIDSDDEEAMIVMFQLNRDIEDGL